MGMGVLAGRGREGTLLGDGNVLYLNRGGDYRGEYLCRENHHQPIHLTCVNIIVCKLYFSKGDTKKR